jgi:hypothetical protein
MVCQKAGFISRQVSVTLPAEQFAVHSHIANHHFQSELEGFVGDFSILHVNIFGE